CTFGLASQILNSLRDFLSEVLNDPIAVQHSIWNGMGKLEALQTHPINADITRSLFCHTGFLLVRTMPPLHVIPILLRVLVVLNRNVILDREQQRQEPIR